MSDVSTRSGSPVRVDLGLCKACGICIELCPEKVFDRDRVGEPVVARADDCTQCLICELHCPDFAIEVRRRERKGKTAAPEVPAVSSSQIVAATRDVAAGEAGCGHNGEEG